MFHDFSIKTNLSIRNLLTEADAVCYERLKFPSKNSHKPLSYAYFTLNPHPKYAILVADCIFKEEIYKEKERSCS